MEEGKRQIAFKCDINLAADFKILCVKEGKTMKDYIIELMVAELEKKREEDNSV